MAGTKGHSGGLRRRHIPPLLTMAQVAEIRAARAAGVPYKILMRRFDVGRQTLSRAALGNKTYGATTKELTP